MKRSERIFLINNARAELQLRGVIERASQLSSEIDETAAKFTNLHLESATMQQVKELTEIVIELARLLLPR